MYKKLFVATTLFILLSLSVFANESAGNLAKQVLSEDRTESQNAINSLRALGQDGLDALFEVYSDEIKTFAQTGKADENWTRISNALDSVAMQKDAYAAKLFWQTDLENAKAIAKKMNKPILSLRLLGNLNEEYSCANSRFFRSILYSNARISEYLRNNYVLHWKSVRPAPRVTIDFGDGRKLERTITGNSIHYVLDQNGRVIDALPGLNSPQKFELFLTTGVSLSNGLVNNQDDQNDFLMRYRSSNYRALTAKINNIGDRLKLKFDTTKPATRKFEAMPSAMMASALAVTKRAVEIDVLADITPDLTQYGAEQIDFQQWQQIAALTNPLNKIDEKSTAFIRRQTAVNNLTDKEFTGLITNLEKYIAVDTARNELLMRPSLLVWLNKGLDRDVEKLNEKIYSDLFLTPNNDKWLGLYAPDLYTALDGNGIIK